MIQLHTDCLVFETSDGEAIPCSAQDVTVELLGDAAHELEPMLVTEAAEAVLTGCATATSRPAATMQDAENPRCDRRSLLVELFDYCLMPRRTTTE